MCFIMVIESIQCVLLIFIMSFRHPSYRYGVQRAYDADPLDPSVLVLQDRHMSHLVDTKQVCILLLIN